MRLLWASGALLCFVSLPGCGGGGSPTGSGEPSRTVITEGSVQLDDPFTAVIEGRICDFLGFVPFTTSAPGTLDVTVNWTSPSRDIDIFVIRDHCDCDEALAGGSTCEDVAASESTAKPERLTVSNLAAGRYTLIVGNEGPGAETASYEIGLSR